MFRLKEHKIENVIIAGKVKDMTLSISTDNVL